jgi:hypothetical protein
LVDEPILDLGVDEQGRLYVRPAQSVFPQIFRVASGVSWDPSTNALVSPQPGEWSLERWFEQIVGAVLSEYGIALRLAPSTSWTGVAPELQRDITAFASGPWSDAFMARQRESDARGWSDFSLSQALRQAGPLWAQGRWAEYVEVLAPMRDRLSAAQLKRISIAERRASGAGSNPASGHPPCELP